MKLPEGFEVESADSSQPLKLPPGFEIESAPETHNRPSFLASVGKSLYQDSPEIAGAITGGIAAAPVAAAALPFVGPTGAYAIDAVGQGLGSAVGGLAKSAYQMNSNFLTNRAHDFGAPSIESPYPNAPATTGQALGEAGKDFASGAGGAVLGQALTAVGKPIVGAIASKLKPAMIEGAQAIKEAFAKYGGQFTIGQITDNAAIDFLENFVSSTMTGAGKYLSRFNLNEKSIAAMADDIASKFSNAINQPGLEEGAKHAVAGILDGRTAFEAAAKPMYQKVDELTADAAVSSLPLKQLVQNTKKALTSSAVDATKATQVSAGTQKAIDIIENLKDSLSFSEAQQLRTSLAREAKDLISGASKDSDAVRLYSTLAKNVSDSMDNAASGLSSKAADAWHSANDFYKMGKEVFNNKLITKVVESDPYVVGKSLFTSNNIPQFRAIKDALQATGSLTKDSVAVNDILQNLRQGHFEQFMTQFADPATGNINGASMLKHVTKEVKMFEEIYGPQMTSKIKDFAKIAQLVSEKSAGKGGGIAGALSQVGAARDIINSINPIADNARRGSMFVNGVSMLFAPGKLAEMMTTPKGIDLITSGFKAPLEKVNTAVARTTAQIVSHALQNQYLATEAHDEER